MNSGSTTIVATIRAVSFLLLLNEVVVSPNKKVFVQIRYTFTILCSVTLRLVAFEFLLSPLPVLAVSANDAVAVAESAAKEVANLLDDGKFPQAKAVKALDRAVKDLGEKHPAVIELLDGRTEAFLEQARHEEALKIREHEIELFSEAHGL